MNKEFFLSELQRLTSQDDILDQAQAINELRSSFDDFVLEQERLFQVAQLEAEEAGLPAPEQEDDLGKEEFYELYKQYRDQRKALQAEKEAIETENLHKKKKLIKALEEIIRSEENIGAAFSAFKEIQEQWKAIGDIPRKDRSDVQSDYSRLIEDFFYNIKIYKELKDHDLHRNQQLKEELIGKLKELAKESSIREVEHQIKGLQNEWEDIGPVPNEDWERLKVAYWTEVRSIYNRITRHYEDRRNAQKENLAKKELLIQQAEELVRGQEGEEASKNWDSTTKKLLALQEEWKKIGFGPRAENEVVWKKFRSTCDRFFDLKKEFGKQAQQVYDEVAAEKQKLIDQAEVLKDSKDWKETTEALKQLQKEWNRIGNAGRKHEQRLWKKFRTACDAFFEAKTAYSAALEGEFEANLIEKNKLIDELKELKLSQNKEEAFTELKDLAARFQAIGRVPLKEKDRVYNAFKAEMDRHYQSMKLDASEKAKFFFQAKIDTAKASHQSSRLLGDIKNDLRKEIETLKREVLQLENNLGFFGRSKGAEALKQDVERKIEAAKQKMEEAKQKLKLIPNE